MKTYDMREYEQRLKRDQLLHNMEKVKKAKQEKARQIVKTTSYPDWYNDKVADIFEFKASAYISVSKEIIKDTPKFFAKEQYPALEEWVKIMENKYEDMFETSGSYSTLDYVSTNS